MGIVVMCDSCREVYRLASGPKVREANPQYEVDIVLDEKCCDPVATLTYGEPAAP